MFFNQSLNPQDVAAAEPVTAFDPDGIEPELGFAVVSIHVNVLRFMAIPGVEEESVGAGPQNSWHGVMLSDDGLGDKVRGFVAGQRTVSQCVGFQSEKELSSFTKCVAVIRWPP